MEWGFCCVFLKLFIKCKYSIRFKIVGLQSSSVFKKIYRECICMNTLVSIFKRKRYDWTVQIEAIRYSTLLLFISLESWLRCCNPFCCAQLTLISLAVSFRPRLNVFHLSRCCMKSGIVYLFPVSFQCEVFDSQPLQTMLQKCTESISQSSVRIWEKWFKCPTSRPEQHLQRC